MATPVLFRMLEGEVTAVFPTLPANPGNHVCYAHLGQHAECSAGWYSRTRPAKPDEYADLLAELRSIGYDDLKPMLRRPSRRH